MTLQDTDIHFEKVYHKSDRLSISCLSSQIFSQRWENHSFSSYSAPLQGCPELCNNRILQPTTGRAAATETK